MVFKNFRIQLILRIICLMANILIFAFFIFQLSYQVTTIMLFAAIILQVILLVRYLEKTNRLVSNFLESVRYTDFNQTYKNEGLGASYEELKKAFNDVILDFQKIRSEKEEHYHYLQNVIQHIGVSLIAFQKNGKVEMLNNAAKKMFQINNLRNILLLKNFSPELASTIMNLKSGENAMVKVQDKDTLMQLAIYCTEFKLQNKIITLVSIQNIHNELEEQEMEAWQKLIRVLTHEMMNSIAPISSLSSTIHTMLKPIDEAIVKKQYHAINQDMFNDIYDSVKTIHKRSEGLMHFVETYRNLTHIPKPNFKIMSVKEIFNSLQNLFQEELNNNKILFSVEVNPDSLELMADSELMEQVFINLIKNSIHALQSKQQPKITLKAYLGSHGKIVMQVIDNGSGITQDAKDKIFIPFYTTKKNGSGIGLSLSRQIIRLHGGTIHVQSESEIGTEVTLKF
jgi:nitrogen fixation/metabolism regulation signal transduction histidine kinase